MDSSRLRSQKLKYTLKLQNPSCLILYGASNLVQRSLKISMAFFFCFCFKKPFFCQIDAANSLVSLKLSMKERTDVDNISGISQFFKIRVICLHTSSTLVSSPTDKQRKRKTTHQSSSIFSSRQYTFWWVVNDFSNDHVVSWRLPLLPPSPGNFFIGEFK